MFGIAWKNFPTLGRATPTAFKVLSSANDISISLVTPIVRSLLGRLTDKSQCYSFCLLCLPTFFQGIQCYVAVVWLALLLLTSYLQ